MRSTPALLLAITCLVATSTSSALLARELLIDRRGGAEFKTLRDAAAVVAPGDTLVLAKGSGPYRESLTIKTSGRADAPIVVEGNGETITAFEPLVFRQEGSTWIAQLPQPFPCVIAQNGRRILQDPGAPETAFLGPVRLRDDKRTLELLPGGSPEGWEASARDCPVRVHNVSHHIYRDIVATGGTNDGFNLHGEGSGLRFENIVGANNLDEGFSPHGGMVCEIHGGDFWGNDNGFAGGPDYVLNKVRIHDNLGWGLVLNGAKNARLNDVQIWGNGMAQIIFNPAAAGAFEQVRVWAPEWPSRPWRSYKESSTSQAPALAFRFDDTVARTNWQGFPEIASGPAPTRPLAATPANPALAGGSAAPAPADTPAAPASPTPAPAAPAALDLARLIKDAIRSGAPTVRIPAGEHRLSQTLIIANARNLVIYGDGATLVMTDGRRGLLHIQGGDGLAIRGLTLAYDPIRHTQATITRADAQSFDFVVQDGYPDIAPDATRPPTHFYTRAGRRHPDTFDFYKPNLRLSTPRAGTALAPTTWPSTLAPGDQVVFDRRELDRANCVEIRENTGPVLFEDVVVHDSPALGFAGRYCEAPVTLRGVTIKPGPKPAGATQPRLFSTNADAVNFVQCRFGPRLERCDFSGMGDDSLNVHGYFLPVVRVLSPTSFLTAAPNGPSGFVKPLRPGDALRIYEPDAFSVVGQAEFAAMRALPDPGDVTLDEMRVLFPIGLGKIYTVYQVDLAAPVALRPGRWFDCPAVNSGGYIVRDSYFHDHRGRGLRIMAGDGLVENNRFERLTKSAISIGPELGFWREAGWVANLRIVGNRIREVGIDRSLAADGSYVPGAIGIFVHTQSGKPPYPAGNENIVIENNVVEDVSVAGIHAYAARGITLRGNTFARTNLVRAAGHVDPVNRLRTSGPVSVDDALEVVSDTLPR